MGVNKAGIIALGVKLLPKFIGLLAKLVKGLKVGKVALFGASAASYTWLLSWQFAVMIMFLLFVHESGHIWAMKRFGMKTKGIYFIPFLGGAAVSSDQFPSRWAESYIALMGPIWGLFLSFASGVVYQISGHPLFAAAASWMAMVNLINLLPIDPLDGGRVIKSIAFSIHSVLGISVLIIGIIASIYITIKFGIALFGILFAICLVELICEWRSRHKKDPVKGMDKKKIAWSVVGYVAVCLALFGLMLQMNHVPGAAAAMEALK